MQLKLYIYIGRPEVGTRSGVHVIFPGSWQKPNTHKHKHKPVNCKVEIKVREGLRFQTLRGTHGSLVVSSSAVYVFKCK